MYICMWERCAIERKKGYNDIHKHNIYGKGAVNVDFVMGKILQKSVYDISVWLLLDGKHSGENKGIIKIKFEIFQYAKNV